MALQFSPVTETAQLPDKGERESQFLEFKTQANYGSLRYSLELAKDIAALANSAGGTLIIGAIESDNVLSHWKSTTPEEAEKIAGAYDLACRDYLKPSPLISTSPVELKEKSGYVTAVNVWPHAGRVIGVIVPLDKTDNARKDVGGEAAYRFPVRVGIHTKHFDPSNLPTSETRRIAADLSVISEGDRIQMQARNDNPGGRYEREVFYNRTDPLRETLLTTNATTQADNAPIPLVDIHSVVVCHGSKIKVRVVLKNEARLQL